MFLPAQKNAIHGKPFCFWIDPVRDVFFILLTNRVHPTRENRKILAVRRAFADAVLDAFDGDEERTARGDHDR